MKKFGSNQFKLFIPPTIKKAEVIVFSLKSLIIGLTGISLCMADISGIVTDTSNTPIAGAIVKLEKGGQTATTGNDGRFKLIVSSAVLRGGNHSLSNGLFANISGNTMIVRFAKKSALEVTTIDMSGKTHLTFRKMYDAGNHSIPLPSLRPGIYLYKLKSGIGDLILKRVVVDGAFSGISQIPQNASPNYLSKQAMRTGAINDVISSTKTGYLNYRCVQYNYDTIGVHIKMIANAGNLTDADGNVYQTVRIGNQVWMAENLRTTTFRDGSKIPHISSIQVSRWTNWDTIPTPAYCWFNDDTTYKEMFGALYNANALNKLAPTGWHVPSSAEWDTLQQFLINQGYNWDGTTQANRIAKALSARIYWTPSADSGNIGFKRETNNRSGFNAMPAGSRQATGMYTGIMDHGEWWTTTNYNGFPKPIYKKYKRLEWNSGYLREMDIGYRGDCLSVRLIKD